MPDEELDTTPQQETETVRFGKGFADTILRDQVTSDDPEDKVLHEIGAEVDRLEDLLTGKNFLKPSMKVHASARRVTALQVLYGLLKDRKAIQEQEGAVQIIARLVRLLKDVLTEMKQPVEVQQTILNNLLEKLEEEEKEAKADKKVKR